MNNLITLSKAKFSQLPAILELQKVCYHEEAELYNSPELPPMIQSIDSIQQDFNNWDYYVLMEKEVVIGSIRIKLQGKSAEIGRLIVSPTHQNKGLGQFLLKEVEDIYSSVERFILFTGDKSTRNLYLYNKLGYRIYTRNQLDNDVQLVWLEKLMN